jgi:hypothetical protein
MQAPAAGDPHLYVNAAGVVTVRCKCETKLHCARGGSSSCACSCSMFDVRLQLQLVRMLGAAPIAIRMESAPMYEFPIKISSERVLCTCMLMSVRLVVN